MRTLFALVAFAAAMPAADRITVLYDSHAAPGLASGWGYSAFVEYRGRRILFDAGPSGPELAQNAKTLGVSLAKLDAVVISHDDPDHYGGLDAVYAANPGVQVYVPEQEYGAFSTSMFNRFIRVVQGALPRQRVVDPPAGAQYVRVGSDREILPGVRLVQQSFGMRREQALVLAVDGGVAMLTGCAHPGIAKMVKSAGAHVVLLTGGFHLTESSVPEIKHAVNELKTAGVGSVYPAHCTGTIATDQLRRAWGPRFGMVAAGGTIPLGK